MKRFVNAYGIRRAAVRHADALYGVDIDKPWKQLALWTIVEMRWPKLAEHLRQAPESVKHIVEGVELPSSTPKEIRELATDPRVQQVVKGEEVGATLSEIAVRAFHGFPPVGGPAAS